MRWVPRQSLIEREWAASEGDRLKGLTMKARLFATHLRAVVVRDNALDALARPNKNLGVCENTQKSHGLDETSNNRAVLVALA